VFVEIDFGADEAMEPVSINEVTMSQESHSSLVVGSSANPSHPQPNREEEPV